MSDEERYQDEDTQEPEAPIERLFVSRIREGIPAEVMTDQGNPVSVAFFGEIVLDGEQQEGEEFVPSKLVRLALIGEPVDDSEGDDDRSALQAIDLTGPLQETPLVPAEETGPEFWSADSVPVRLYYSKLGQLVILTEEEERFPPHPPAEFAVCDFLFKRTESEEEDNISLALEKLSIELIPESIVENGGVVRAAFFDPADLTFQELKPRPRGGSKSAGQPLKM